VKAREAIAAYQQVLNIESDNDEAYNATIYLCRAIRDEEAANFWLMRRANDPQVAATKRAQAYTLMASREWNCSYVITEKKENKVTVTWRNRQLLLYRKPEDQRDFNTAKQCAGRGLELIEQAINLDAESEQAWSYKTNLLIELVKLAEMQGDHQLKVDYQERGSEAQLRTAELTEKEKRRREDDEKKKVESMMNQSLPSQQ